MNRVYSLLFFILFYARSFSVSAQESYIINDLLNDKTYTYTTKYMVLKNNKWNFYNHIDVEYPVITNLADSILGKKLNNRFKQILVEQIESDSFKIKLFLDLKNRLATYFANNSYIKDRLGTYRDNEFKFTPDILEIEFRFLSCYKSVVSFAAIFRYKSQFQNYVLEEDLNYFEVYYFNLTNGKEYKPADVFKKTSEKEVSTLIQNAVKKNIENIEIKMEEYDYNFYNDIETPNKDREKKLIDFILNQDGFAYLKAFSLAYYIPAFSPCTKNINGLDAEVRLSFDEIKKHLNPKGPYGQLITFAPDTTLSKKVNNPLLPYRDNIFTPRFLVYEVIPNTIGGNIKTIYFKRILPSAKDKADTNRVQLGRQIEYQKNGNIKEVKNYSDGKLNIVQVFNFDTSNNLIKKASIKNGKLDEAEDYSYDKNGNLISISKMDAEQVPEKTFYYYTKTFTLEERYGYYRYKTGIENNYIKKTINEAGLTTNILHTSTSAHSKNSERAYKYDSKGHLLLSYDKKNQPSTGQSFVYDKNGNLLTYENDNGRYYYEYKYDDRNNLIRETHYDNKSIRLVRKAEYDTNNHLIKIEITDSYNSNPQVYTLSYDFW